MENESPFRGFSTADFQKLLHNVSSLVGSNESLAFEIPAVTYCMYIFVLANRAKVSKYEVGSDLISISVGV